VQNVATSVQNMIYGVGFDCFDHVTTLNKKRISLFLVLAFILLVGTFCLMIEV
jgi:hypothetical protein